MNVNFALNYTVLSNLTAYTIYVINVAAVSSGGKGPAKTTWVRTQAEGKIQVETIEFLLPYNISSDTYNNQKTLFLLKNNSINFLVIPFSCHDLKNLTIRVWS